MNDINLQVTGKAIAVPPKQELSPPDKNHTEELLFKEEDLLHSEVKELILPDGDPDEFSETPVKAVAIGGKQNFDEDDQEGEGISIEELL